jgi:hypothetical protein
VEHPYAKKNTKVENDSKFAAFNKLHAVTNTIKIFQSCATSLTVFFNIPICMRAAQFLLQNVFEKFRTRRRQK